MGQILSRMIRKIPPFRYIYIQIAQLERQGSVLTEELHSSDRQLKTLQADNDSLKKTVQKYESFFRKQEEIIQKQQAELSVLKKQMTSIKTDGQKLKLTVRDKDRELEREIEYYYWKGLDPDKYEENLKEWYHRKTGKTLDLEHPKTFNEKIQWMKLYDSTPLKTRLADKFLVRDWVREKIGSQYLIPLLGVYDTFDDIDFDALPEKFVIKTNHAYATNWIVTDKSEFDCKAAKRFFDKWMNRNFAFWSGLQLHYRDIVPKIIVEEYLENSENNLDDYKVYCFDGKAYYIEYMTGRNQDMQMAFYDKDWNLMPFTRAAAPCESPVKKPGNLKQMLSLAETLSEGFSHVRVDFYYLNNDSIKFGEMTFTTSAGAGAWNPEEYDRIFGDYIKLPTDEMQ